MEYYNNLYIRNDTYNNHKQNTLKSIIYIYEFYHNIQRDDNNITVL